MGAIRCIHTWFFFGVRGGLYYSSLSAMLCIFHFSSLQKIIFQATSTQWNAFLLFDVLQCIGIGLLLLCLLLVIVRREKLFLGTLTVLLFVIVYSTPIFWTARVQQIFPLTILSTVNGLTGSSFPLFPFVGFLLASTCVSWLFLRAVQGGHEGIFVKWLMLASALLVAVGLLFDALPFQVYVEYFSWNTSPSYFWMRLGLLLLMLGGLWYLEDYFATRGGIQ